MLILFKPFQKPLGLIRVLHTILDSFTKIKPTINKSQIGPDKSIIQIVTDRNILEDSYQLVKHFPDFLLWEYKIASFKQNVVLKETIL